MLFSLVYGGIMAVMGGYVTAAIANQAELKHALALAAVVGIMALVSMAAASRSRALMASTCEPLDRNPCSYFGRLSKALAQGEEGENARREIMIAIFTCVEYRRSCAPSTYLRPVPKGDPRVR